MASTLRNLLAASVSTPERRRRFAIAAAVGLLIVAVQVGRVAYLSKWQPDPGTAETSPTTPGFQPGAIEADSSGTTPAVDLDAAALRFQRDIAAAPSGTWTYIAEGPVLAPGAIDEWDDFSIGYTSVLRDGDGASDGYQLWYRGCSLGVRGHRCAIGHARSPDGIRWKKTPSPVFEPPEPQAGGGLRALTVVRANGRYYMWYSIAPSWLDGRKTSTLHLATSADGIAWEAAGQVFAGTEQIERHLDPSALWDGERFHLWVVDSMQVFEKDAYKPLENAPFLRHLVSPDGRAWKERGSFPLGTLQIAHARPTVSVRPGGGYRAVLFDPDDIVALTWIESADGDTWAVASPPRTTLTVPPVEQVELVDDATALDVPGGTLAWLAGGKDGKHAVRIAFLRR